MKKIISILLIIILVLALGGCGKEDFEEFYSKFSSEIVKLLPETEEIVEIQYEYYNVVDPQLNSCYNTLNGSQRDFYSRIYAISEEMSEGFVNLGENYDGAVCDVAIAYRAFLNDNADVFWMPSAYILATKGSGSQQILAIAFDYSDGENQNSYTVNKSERSRMKNELSAVAEKIKNKTDTLKSEYEKEKYINDYICKNVSYSETGTLIDTAYGALVLGSALCEGYAKAFKLLCNQADIECDLITGTADNTGHMWNRVNIDRKHSYVDVTWNDRNEYITYAYFNINEEKLLKTHKFFPLITELSKEEITNGSNFNFTQKDCGFTGNMFFEKTDRILWFDYADKAVMGITEAKNQGYTYAEFMFSGENVEELFEKDPTAFISDIQLKLADITINAYLQERDTVIFFFE